MEELTTLNQEKPRLDWRTHCIWCRLEFGPDRKKSKEDVLLTSLGSNLQVPILCEPCNNRLGNTVDKYLNKDFWINRAKSILVRRGVKDLKIAPKFQDDGRSEKMIELYKPDGKANLVFPDTDRKTYRAVAKIAFMVAAIGLGNLMFDPFFDNLRTFIEKGKPDLIGNMDREIGILRSYHNRNWKERHSVIFKFKRPNLGIDVVLFDSLWFTTFFRLDRDIKVTNFKIVQLIHPYKEPGLFLEDENGKYKFDRSLKDTKIF